MLIDRGRWWVPVLRGAVAALFGILAIVWPGMALLTLVALFGAYALADGVISLVGMASGASGKVPWWLQMLIGVTGVMAGILTFVHPLMTAVVLLSFIAAYALVVGGVQFVAAVHQRGEPGAVFLGVSGLVSALFGLLMILRPEVGALAVAWLIGCYAILAGGALIGMGLSLRNAGGTGIRAVFWPAEREYVGPRK